MTTVDAVPVGFVRRPQEHAPAEWSHVVENFVSMGFEQSEAAYAVRQARGQEEQALNLLIEAEDRKKAQALFGSGDTAREERGGIVCTMDESTPPLSAGLPKAEVVIERLPESVIKVLADAWLRLRILACRELPGRTMMQTV